MSQIYKATINKNTLNIKKIKFMNKTYKNVDIFEVLKSFDLSVQDLRLVNNFLTFDNSETLIIINDAKKSILFEEVETNKISKKIKFRIISTDTIFSKDYNGLYNFTSFYKFIKMNKKNITHIGFLDFNKLKELNSSIGYLEVDKILKKIINDISNATNNLFFRFHGDEFLYLILKDQSVKEVIKELEEINNKYTVTFTSTLKGNITPDSFLEDLRIMSNKCLDLKKENCKKIELMK
ncbi:MAG: diguanylate cyclase domain-containing protein [Anaeroplasmataceae bacterium]